MSGPNSNLMQRDPAILGRSSPVHILARSDCDSDQKKCGDECFPKSYECCPDDASVGCPSNKECQKDDGKYGCCTKGETCHWDANDNDDDDHDSVFDKVDDAKNNVKDKWDDFWDNSGPGLEPKLLTLGVLAGVAAMGLVI